MANEHYRLQFFTLHTAILCLLLHRVQSNMCEKALQNINNCWDWNRAEDLTACLSANSTNLGRCVLAVKKNLKTCDSDLVKSGEHRSKLYLTLMDVICHNKTIYKEFETNKDCWHIAQACAYSIVQLPLKTTDLICQNVTAIVDDCKSKKHEPSRGERCMDVTKTFLDRLLKESEMCSAATFCCRFSFLLVLLFILTLL